MSAKTQSQKDALAAQFRSVVGCSQSDALKYLKKYTYNLERAIDGFFNDPSAQQSMSSANNANASATAAREKKLGEIYDKYAKEVTGGGKMIDIDGTMSLCEDLGIDPQSDPVLFCLAADLGSKTVGEWEKKPWVDGWKSLGSNIDSIQSMKSILPTLRSRLKTDPEYFKKVYLHVFELSKVAGARTLALEAAVSFWQVLIPPALSSRPSALSHLQTNPSTGDQTPSPDPTPLFTTSDLELWIEFIQEKGKAVSRDTWALFREFVRVIDTDFREFDESGAWPSTIDEFVEYGRKKKGTA